VLVGDVLLAIDDTPIESPEALIDVLMITGAGHRARVQLLRGGAAIELTVDIGERPAP
jgi:S1-C subfamily serine protease